MAMENTDGLLSITVIWIGWDKILESPRLSIKSKGKMFKLQDFGIDAKGKLINVE